MGLSIAISGGIIMFGITYLMFSLGGVTDNISSMSDSSIKMTDFENKRIKTEINIDSITTSGTSPQFSFDVTNTGLEKLWEFEKFDVIVTYDNSGTTYTEVMTFSSSCPPTDGEWCIDSFSNDVIDPEILNTGETMTIDTEVSNNLQNNRDLIVVISTQNGIVATATVVV